MVKKFFLSSLLMIGLHTIATAQVQPDPVVIDSLEVAIAEEEMLYKEDSADFVYYSLPVDIEYIPGDDDPAVLRDRLACIERTIPLVYNDKIHAFINYFTIKDREYTRLMMKRKNLYFPLFEKYLAKYGLPDELKYLSIIESGLNPKAVSRARAVGLWQFMSATGKYYGLNHDWYVDERMDPEKATDAACRYLRDLYRMFNDWELALAAYNTGPGNVRKAMRKSTQKETFWDIYPNLHRDTRAYVPQFVAMTYTMNYLDEHNFFDVEEELFMPHDTLRIDRHFDFKTYANLTGICPEDLQRLNPSILHNAAPERSKPYYIQVPVLSKMNLEVNRLAVLDSASKVGRKELMALAQHTDGSTLDRDRITYKVKRGDVLGSIALRHGVKVEDIKKWNNLNSTVIHEGQRLNIYTRASVAQAAVAQAQKVQTTPVSTADVKTYVVQPGDTLWNISQKFEGMTIEKLKTLNNLNSTKIQPGQKLVVGI